MSLEMCFHNNQVFTTCLMLFLSTRKETVMLAFISMRANKNLEFLSIFVYLLEKIRLWGQTSGFVFAGI